MKDEILNPDHMPTDPGPLAPYVLQQLTANSAPEERKGFILHIRQVEKLDFRTLLHDVGASRLVLLFRENTTEQFTSLRTALKTNCWSDTSDSSVRVGATPVTIDAAEILEFRNVERSLWESIVLHGIPPEMPVYVVRYEDLDKDFNACVPGILRFLDVEPDWEFKPLSQKQRVVGQHNSHIPTVYLELDLDTLVRSRQLMHTHRDVPTASMHQAVEHVPTEDHCMDDRLRGFFRRQESPRAAISLLEDLDRMIAQEPHSVARDNHTRQAEYLRLLIDNEDFSFMSKNAAWLSESWPPVTFPTTTELEVQQLLLWLVRERGCKIVMEVGCWLGHTTMLLARSLATRGGVVVAVDSFQWQEWMNTYAPEGQVVGTGFLQSFQQNISEHKAHVRTWEVDDAAKLNMDGWRYGTIDLVFMDFSRSAEELAGTWRSLAPHMLEQHTLVVVNGYGQPGVCAFLHQHCSDMRPLYKPQTADCKVFLFEPDFGKDRKLCFAKAPANWQHHHAGGWVGIVDEHLKPRLHHRRAPTKFIPAVEQYFAEHGKMPDGPWCGVMHQAWEADTYGVQNAKECLRDPLFLEALRSCKGLLTLTKFGADKIRSAMPSNQCVPVTSVKYPLPGPGRLFDIEAALTHRKVVMVGSYMRDYQTFFDATVPDGWEKVLRSDAPIEVPPGVSRLGCLSAEVYEDLLAKSVIFLSMSTDGVANTILVECVLRGTPLVTPKTCSAVEYLGAEYPLFFTEPAEVHAMLEAEPLRETVAYLRALDKTPFCIEGLLESFMSAPFYRALPCIVDEDEFGRVDVTILVISFKRTHDLSEIIKRLWCQDYTGNFELFVWNNNPDRDVEVLSIVEPFERLSNRSRRVTLARMSRNFYCAPRFAMLALMRGRELLVCDDDVLPEPGFISGFMKARMEYGPKALLCLCGHCFEPHQFDPCLNPFESHTHVRFVPDEDPACEIHVAHLDAGLIPLDVLRQASAVPLPDESFMLVDDYWLSYVSSSHLRIPIQKLHGSSCPCRRTMSAEDPKVALFQNPRVEAARWRMYQFHMQKNWPHRFAEAPGAPSVVAADQKVRFWEVPHIGFNIDVPCSEQILASIADCKIDVVRIGAAGGTDDDHDLAMLKDLPKEPIAAKEMLRTVTQAVDTLESYGLHCVLTLNRSVASAPVWEALASALCGHTSVVGYDLINEPFVSDDNKEQVGGVGTAVEPLFAEYRQMIEAVRRQDVVTPIILSSSYGGHPHALHLLLNEFAADYLDLNLLFTFHWYEPRALTSRKENLGRFAYPGFVPSTLLPEAAHVEWTRELLAERFHALQKVLQSFHIPACRVFLGELGIARETEGAAAYMADVLAASSDCKWSVCLWAFRERRWDAFNYELGPELHNKEADQCNEIFTAIREAIAALARKNSGAPLVGCKVTRTRLVPPNVQWESRCMYVQGRPVATQVS